MSKSWWLTPMLIIMLSVLFIQCKTVETPYERFYRELAESAAADRHKIETYNVMVDSLTSNNPNRPTIKIYSFIQPVLLTRLNPEFSPTPNITVSNSNNRYIIRLDFSDNYSSYLSRSDNDMFDQNRSIWILDSDTTFFDLNTQNELYYNARSANNNFILNSKFIYPDDQFVHNLSNAETAIVYVGSHPFSVSDKIKSFLKNLIELVENE